MPSPFRILYNPASLGMAFLGLVCGLGLYVILINRVLSRLRDGRFKSTFLPLTLVICLATPVLIGIFGTSFAWRLVLVSILALMAAGELHYRLIDRRLRSDPPIHNSGRPFSILHPITTRDLRVLRYEAPLPGWSGSALRIAHLTDFHAYAGCSVDYFRAVIELANESLPDLVFLTGDFTADEQGISLLPEFLAPLRSRLGIFAILGNHDFWIDPGRVKEMIDQSGITLLPGGCQHNVQDGDRPLTLVGCAAPWSGETCELTSQPEIAPVLVLSHTADHIYWLSRAGAAAVFSGHYHAGQMQLPYFGPLIVPSQYGRRFYQGHFKVGETHLFVSAGVGESHPPMRIYCPPDILLVDFLAKPGQGLIK
jgi:predicted MPP superfamily phosphohydrolase